jgi:hypothetical protein
LIAFLKGDIQQKQSMSKSLWEWKFYSTLNQLER